MIPETFTKYSLIVKSITYQALNLFLYSSVEIFQGVRNYFLFLMFKGVIYWFKKFGLFGFNPFGLVADLFGQFLKLLNYARLELLDRLNIFLFHKVLVNIVYKLLKTLFRDHSDPIWKAKLYFSLQHLYELISDFLNLLLYISISLLIIRGQHLLYDLCDILPELFVELSLWSKIKK